jgi:hypothetical protein
VKARPAPVYLIATSRSTGLCSGKPKVEDAFVVANPAEIATLAVSSFVKNLQVGAVLANLGETKKSAELDFARAASRHRSRMLEAAGCRSKWWIYDETDDYHKRA